MLTALDHIIIGVHDLAAAARVFEQRLGLVPSGGGVHPGVGTANRIIVLGDTYLELITIDRPQEAQESMRARLAKGEGYLNFVLASDDIEAEVQAIRGRGVEMIGPTPGELRSGDGRTRSWKRADIERVALTQRYPFLIQHDSMGEERRRRLAGWSTPPEHPLGVTRVHSVTLAVADLAEATQRFAHLLGLTPFAPSSATMQGQSVQRVAFSLPTSGQAFELAASSTSSTLSAHLARYGESMYCMTLQVRDLAQARRYLDEHQVAYTEAGDSRPQLWLDSRQTYDAPIALQAAN